MVRYMLSKSSAITGPDTAVLLPVHWPHILPEMASTGMLVHKTYVIDYKTEQVYI